MHLPSAVKTTLPALLFTALLGCGSSGTSGNGTMNVHLVDGPAVALDSVQIQVRKLEIHGPNGWETLVDYGQLQDDASQHILNGIKTIPNLLDLHGGIAETLAFGKTLPVGHYEQMRMLLGPDNKVTPVGGVETTLTVPSGMQSGLKFDVSFDVAPNTTRDVFIDFAADRSIFIHAAGASGKYMLRPVIRAYDKFMTGAVAGTLTAASNGAPLPGVVVLAETLVGSPAQPVIVRSTKTGDDGKYLLDLLPDGGTYYIVAQPVVTVTTPVPSTTVYEARTSGPKAITESAAVQAYDAAFATVSAVGAVKGGITSAAVAPAADEVVVEQDFGSGLNLIIRSEGAAVNSGVEDYEIDFLPAGAYGLAAIRGSVDVYGVYTEAERTTPPLAITIANGVTTDAPITGM